MNRYLTLLLALLLFTACGEEKKETSQAEEPELSFTSKNYYKKTTLPCSDPCANVRIDVPVAEGVPVVADSINKKIFRTVKSIIFFGEKPYTADNYEDLMASFIGSYEELKKDFPEDMMGWEGRVKGTIDYRSDSILNIKLNHYTFTGGAHGYEGNRSLLFNLNTGKSLHYNAIFKDVRAFTTFAETKFREKYSIPAGKSINSTGLMFPDDAFILPQNIFFKEDGLLLYYNAYEIASYAEQQKELFLPYEDINSFLKLK